MPSPDSFTWFDEGFIGRVIEFPPLIRRTASSWRLTTKLGERYNQLSARDVEDDNHIASEAWATYLCVNVEKPAEKAVVKIRMQIPYKGSESNSATSRSQQATWESPKNAEWEIKALRRFAERGCTSTPTLLSYLQKQQDANMWIAQGYIFYILMTYCPGSCPANFLRMTSTEREEIREAFWIAYQECTRCQIVNVDQGIDNLLWDNETKKCYIVDFRNWEKPMEMDESKNWILKAWNLVK